MAEVRSELIGTPAGTGGHLGPNHVVEPTIAMHKVFTTPKDKLCGTLAICYVHKLLTGRQEKFKKIRQTGGLNGFALRTESEHIVRGRMQARLCPRRWACARRAINGNG